MKIKSLAIIMILMFFVFSFVSCTNQTDLSKNKTPNSQQELQNEKEKVIDDVMQELNQITIDVAESEESNDTEELLDALTE